MGKYGSEEILPYNEEEEKSAQVERMFDSIAGKYDLLNHTLSLGFDKGWRRKAIRSLQPFSPQNILDIATGTGDLAIEMYKRLGSDRIIGVDFSENMMEVARKKVAAAGYSDHISFEWENSLSLTFPADTFDAVTAAFGVRNFADIEKGIAEMYRVLRPGGRLMILELTTPEYFPMKQLFRLYSGTVIPMVGWLISREKKAYDYLPASIQVVPQGRVMTDLLTRIGFHEAKIHTFTSGICSMYTGFK